MLQVDPEAAGSGNFTPPPMLGHVNIGAYTGHPKGGNSGDIYYNILSNSLHVYDREITQWVTVPGVLTGSGAPTSTPTYVGQYYLDTTNKIIYVSTDVTASTDWYQLAFTTSNITGNAATATTLQTARNINGVSFNGSADITVAASTTNALTIGTGLSGTSFNGSSAVTIANSGVLSVNGSTGAVSNVAVTNASNTFTAGQTITPSSGTAATINPAASAVGLQIKVNAANALTVRNNADTSTIASIDQYGGASFTYATLLSDAATTRPLAVRGASGQTADLQQWQSSAGTVLGGRNAAGQTFAGSTASVVGNTTTALTSAAYTSATVAVFTYGGTSLVQVGQTVTVAGVSGGAYNGTWVVSAVTATTFTVLGSGFTNVAGTGGTFKLSAVGSFTAGTAAITPLVAKGAASQSANLFELQDSTGAVIVGFDASGNILRGGLTNMIISTSRNVQFASGSGSFGGGGGVLGIANAGTVPTSNATGGGILYAEGGALKWRGSSGGVTIVADTSTAYSVETIKADGNQSATFAIDAGAGTTHTVTLTGSIGTALTFSNLPSDGSITLTLIISQDATGSRTVTWPSGTKWAGGTAPTLSTAANAVDIVTLVVNRSGGSTSAVYGFLAGKAFA